MVLHGAVRALVISNGMAMLLYSGSVFGWGSFQLILEAEGVFRYKCEQAATHLVDSEPCPQQLVEYNFCYTVASTIIVGGGILSGIVIDRYGPCVPSLLAGVFISTAAFLLSSIDETTGMDMPFDGKLSQLFLGVVLLAFGGNLSFMSTFCVDALLSPEEGQFTIAVFCNFFDASAGVFLVFLLLYRESNVALKSIFQVYGSIAVVLYSCIFLLWCYIKYMGKSSDKSSAVGASLAAVQQNGCALMDASEEMKNKESEVLAAVQQNGYALEHASEEMKDKEIAVLAAVQQEGNALMHASEEMKDKESVVESMGHSTHNTSDDVTEVNEVNETPSRFADRTISEQLRSRLFWIATVYTTIHVLRSNVFLGSTKDMLEYYGDAETGYTYTMIFSLSIPCSMVAAPFIAKFINRFGFVSSFQATNLMALSFGSICLIPILEAQPATFFIYTLYRALLYGAICAFNVRMFGPKNCGRVHGVMFCIAGIINYLQQPVVAYTHQRLRGDLRPLFAGLLIAIAPLVLLIHISRRTLCGELCSPNTKAPSTSAGTML